MLPEDENRKKRLEKIKEKENKVTDYDEENLEMGDKFDVIKQVITVNSPISTMNPDFIMSDLSINTLSNPATKYIRKQLLIQEVISIYLSNQETEDEEWRLNISRLLGNDIYSLVNLSRADNAKVIRSILKYIESGQGDVAATTIAEGNNPEETEQTKGSMFNPKNWFK